MQRAFLSLPMNIGFVTLTHPFILQKSCREALTNIYARIEEKGVLKRSVCISNASMMT
jgi:hypothetical protein